MPNLRIPRSWIRLAEKDARVWRLAEGEGRPRSSIVFSTSVLLAESGVCRLGIPLILAGSVVVAVTRLYPNCLLRILLDR
jgi:hypothetical protein